MKILQEVGQAAYAQEASQPNDASQAQEPETPSDDPDIVDGEYTHAD